MLTLISWDFLCFAILDSKLMQRCFFSLNLGWPGWRARSYIGKVLFVLLFWVFQGTLTGWRPLLWFLEPESAKFILKTLTDTHSWLQVLGINLNLFLPVPRPWQKKLFCYFSMLVDRFSLVHPFTGFTAYWSSHWGFMWSDLISTLCCTLSPGPVWA